MSLARGRPRAPKAFVAWDGEGLTRRGKHEYVLLASSAHRALLVDARGLPTIAVLDALLDGFAAAPHAVHVGFAISYDVNMLLRDVPRATLRKLWDCETVVWCPVGQRRRYRLTWRPRKFFRVQARETSRDVWRGGTWWDVWPFFQSSFVTALTKYGIASEDYLADMARMKAKRATFTARELPAIARYNARELESLVSLMRALQTSLERADLQVTRWDGPGALASHLLAREQYRATITAEPPDAVLDACQYAYYGGRIECLQYGHRPARGRSRTRVWHYDINSAYPAAMQHLPCRRAGCGRWVRNVSRTLSTFTVYRVRWHFQPAPLHPFPWRSAKGSVFFPPRGEGWVWQPELVAAINAGLRADFDIVESWTWRKNRRCRHAHANAWVGEWYKARQAAKARGDAAEHAIKLALNSLYGKTAQRVGAIYRGGDEWQLPPYHDLAGAGWITSCVRAQLFTAAMQDPTAVLMLATDGIFSTRPLDLPGSPPGEKVLGAWDFQAHTGATIVQSGVYFLDHADADTTLYSRGFDASSVRRGAIVRAWRRGAHHVTAAQERFIGLGRALAGAESWRLWRRWMREPREIALHPHGTKRTPVGTRNPATGFRRTMPADTARFWADVIGGRGMMTTPSAVPWRALPGVGVGELDAVGRQEDESEDATL